MSADKTPHCCFLGREDPPLPCTLDAEWVIRFGEGNEVDDYTESCTDHVGHLLTDAPFFTIYPVASDPTRLTREAPDGAGC